MLFNCTRETYAQIYNAAIFPEGIDGEYRECDFLCNVTRIMDGVQRQTQWTLIKDGVETFILFTSEGLGQTGFENYEVSPATFRSNFSILVFDETFDNNQIGCGAGGVIVSIFDLRIISE